VLHNERVGEDLAAAIHDARAGRPHQAIEGFKAALKADPKSFDAAMWLGILLRQTGKNQEALPYAKLAAQLRPMEAHAHSNLGLIQLALHDLLGATASLERSAEINPKIPQNYYHLGTAYQLQARDDDAIKAFEKALIQAPTAFDTLFALSQSLINQMEMDRAIEYAELALGQKPNSAATHLLLANAYIGDNQIEQAERHMKAAIELDPKEGSAHAMLGMRLQGLGRIDEANESFKRSIDLQPNQGFAYCALIRNHKVADADAAMIEQMERLVAEGNTPLRGLSFLHFGLGKAYEDLKQYEKAMRHFDEANRISYQLRFGTKTFDKSRYAAGIDWAIKTYTKEFFKQSTAAASDSDAPILIVGMMRSGTTLLEQILSSHPQVEARGEQPFWMKQGPKAIRSATGTVNLKMLRELAEEYLATLRSKGATAPHLTDKMPDNYLALGLIHAAFPNARIFHTRRNPIDTCISIYTTPNRTSDEYANDRENIVFAYEQYLRLMEHWRSVLPPNRFYEVSYEELISNRETLTREMIAFLGLEWDDACLHPEDNDRVVWTPSVWQVRQPVYTTSVARWQKYEPWLGAFAALRTQ